MHLAICVSHSLGDGLALTAVCMLGAEDQPGVPGEDRAVEALFSCQLVGLQVPCACYKLVCCMQYNLDPCGPTHILLGGKASRMSAAGVGTRTSRPAHQRR